MEQNIKKMEFYSENVFGCDAADWVGYWLRA